MADKYINPTGLGAIRDWIKGKIAERASLNVTQIGTNKYAAEITQGNDVFRCDEPTNNLIDMKWVDTTASHNVTEKIPTQGYVDDEIAKKAELSVVGGAGNTLVAETSSASKKITLASPDATGKVLANWNDGTQTKSANIATDTYVDSKTSQATSDNLGTVKLNPSESVGVNASGQLTVGGRLGQFPNGGVFYPTTIEPTNVGASSFLMSDGAKNLSLGGRHFGIMAGASLTCKSASAGATQYRLSNTQGNRFACFAGKNGRLALNQADAQANGTALITSIKFANGNDISAYFGPTESSNDIIVTLERTINPSAATTKLRVYGTSTSNDVIVVGQGCGASGGKAISLGQSCHAGGNQCISFGNASLSLANNSVAFGHTNLVNKQFCFCAGQGHDFTNGSNGVGAVGIASLIDSNTAFAVGNGVFNANGNITRSNAFEVTKDGGVVLPSPDGSRFKIKVANDGTISSEKLV